MDRVRLKAKQINLTSVAATPIARHFNLFWKLISMVIGPAENYLDMRLWQLPFTHTVRWRPASKYFGLQLWEVPCRTDIYLKIYMQFRWKSVAKVIPYNFPAQPTANYIGQQSPADLLRRCAIDFCLCFILYFFFFLLSVCFSRCSLISLIFSET